jgi:hypothetical protein
MNRVSPEILPLLRKKLMNSQMLSPSHHAAAVWGLAQHSLDVRQLLIPLIDYINMETLSPNSQAAKYSLPTTSFV